VVPVLYPPREEGDDGHHSQENQQPVAKSSVSCVLTSAILEVLETGSG
jgi:hypothetical protein